MSFDAKRGLRMNKAAEIELALFERVTPSVVAGEFNQIEDIDKHGLDPPTVPQ